MNAPSGNSENFTLHDFFKISGNTLKERVSVFSDVIRDYNTKGYTMYSREIIGSPGPRVQVRDPLTGTVREMIMMGSNDYLGLSHHPLVKSRMIESVENNGVGMGGPPLLNGMSETHRKLERALARLKNQEDSLIFASGFQANLGWTNALLRSGDVVIFDELNHASFFDGLAATRATRKVRALSFAHNDVNDLEEMLKRSQEKRGPDGQIFVMVEGVYSMDGDLCPLAQVCDLTEKYQATLVVDDAHGTGVIGEHGGGASDYYGVSERVGLSIGTFSKTFGVTGGFIAASSQVVDYLRFFSRSYIFSAHLPQSIATAVLAGCEIIAEQPQLRQKLRKNVEYFVAELRKLGLDVNASSAIVPIRTPQPIDLRLLNRALHERGLFVNAIEYPAVSLAEQRIRMSLMAGHTQKDLDEAIAIIRDCGREYGLITR